MQPFIFHGWLADRIDRFIALRRLAGGDYSSQARLLTYFDRFLVEHYPSGSTVTRQIVEHYLHSLARLQPRVLFNRFSVVRQLCEYIVQTDPRCYVPQSMRCVTAQQVFHPYIFSGGEIESLLSAASALSPSGSLRPHTYRTLFGLLYAAGIRIGEAFALELKDFQPENDLLYIAEGKFRKARWVPLHPSVSRELHRYTERRLMKGPRGGDAPLFLNLRAGRLCHCTVYHAFRQVLEKCGIEHHEHTGPRIHDLRHTFAVHRLLAWYRDGLDVNARLPALATYMGHVDVTSTQVYLRPTAELLELVGNRFHNHYMHNVKHHGGRS
jgi:site-specific recombinase XerD